MNYFVSLSDGSHRSYSGLSQQTIEALIQAEGKTCVYITSEQYDAAVQALLAGE